MLRFGLEIINWFKKFKYQTVCVRNHIVRWTDKNNFEQSFSYVCKENGFGWRKVVIHSDGLLEDYKFPKATEYYHAYILPWVERSLECEVNVEPKIEDENRDIETHQSDKNIVDIEEFIKSKDKDDKTE